MVQSNGSLQYSTGLRTLGLKLCCFLALGYTAADAGVLSKEVKNTGGIRALSSGDIKVNAIFFPLKTISVAVLILELVLDTNK